MTRQPRYFLDFDFWRGDDLFRTFRTFPIIIYTTLVEVFSSRKVFFPSKHKACHRMVVYILVRVPGVFHWPLGQRNSLGHMGRESPNLAVKAPARGESVNLKILSR